MKYYDATLEKVFSIATPFFILLMLRDGFSVIGIFYTALGFASMYMWYKNNRLNKIKQKQWTEIRQLIYWCDLK